MYFVYWVYLQMGASYFDMSVDQGGQRLGASAQQVPSALFASCGSKLPSLVPWCFRTHYPDLTCAIFLPIFMAEETKL
jgi:hypothetical protein